MADPSPPISAAARKGRRIALGLFFGVVVALTATLSGQISWHVYSPQPAPDPSLECRPQVVLLAAAVDRAKAASNEEPSDPEQALARFRQQLSPAWDLHPQIAQVCSRDPKLAELLDAVERLRYAEENAVRRDARDLSPLRRRVVSLLTP